MPIDYMIDLPCEPKRRLGEATLLGHLRTLDHAGRAETLSMDERAEARQAVFDLSSVSFHCARCPANARGTEFGCYGVVPCPISADAEEWLVGLLPGSLNPPRSRQEELIQAENTRLLLRALRDRGTDGGRADAGRPVLLERPAPVARSYGYWFGRKWLSSSQLIEAMLFRGRLDRTLAEDLCRAAGIWVDGGRGEDGLPEAVFTQPVEAEDDPSVAALKRFFHTVMVAASLDLSVRTWVSD